MKIDVRADTKELMKMFSRITIAESNKATARAINHTLKKARTETSRTIREKYAFPSDQVKKALFIKQATSTNVTGLLQASTFTMPLALMKPIEIKGSVETKFYGSKKGGGFASRKLPARKAREVVTGVSVEVIKGQRKTIPMAFLSFAKSGKGNVKAKGEYTEQFNFSTDKGAKNSRLKTKSIYWAITGDRLNSIVLKRVSEDYVKRLQYEVGYIVSQTYNSI